MKTKTIITASAYILMILSSNSYGGVFDYLSLSASNSDEQKQPITQVETKVESLNDKTIYAVDVANKAQLLADQAVATAALKAREAAGHADKLADIAKQLAIKSTNEANKKLELAKIAEAKAKFTKNLAKEVSSNLVIDKKSRNKNNNYKLTPIAKSMIKNSSVNILYTKLEKTTVLADKLAKEIDESHQEIINVINEVAKKALLSSDVANTAALIAKEIANKANEKANVSIKYAKQQNINAEKVEKTMQVIRKTTVTISNEEINPTTSLEVPKVLNNIQNDV